MKILRRNPLHYFTIGREKSLKVKIMKKVKYSSPLTIDRFNRIRIENEKNREAIHHRRKIKILKVQGRPRGHSTIREVEHT